MEWPRQYFPVQNREHKVAFEAELRKELMPGHSIFGIPVACIGKRCDRDDFLYEFLDGSGRVAEVHLTYAGAENPPWPDTTIFNSFGEWRESAIHEFQ